jgi:hypothetical protein
MVTLNESPSRSSRGCLKTPKSLAVPRVEFWGMSWGTMMSPALWQLESEPPPRKGVSRLGSELYRDDNLEAHLIKVQTKKLSS